MADALFRSHDISTAGCELLAASLGLSLSEYQACVSRAATNARIDDEYRLAKQAGLGGLPTVWIGDRVFVGLQSIDTFRAAFAEAARGKTTRLPTALLWLVFAVALAAVSAIAVHVRAGPTASS
jgi:predicted DsbA family dithiol-disulfide isomerase